MKQEEQRSTLVIVGHGKLANAIRTHIPELDATNNYIQHIQNYDDVMDTNTNTILIHVGSGRQYPECLAWALTHRAAFIQAATLKAIPMLPPPPGTIVYLHAPNMDMHLMKLLYWLTLGAKLFQQEGITITESHQSTKTSVPGTAYKICDILGIDPSQIESIRDPAIQHTLNIATLEQHAYHHIVIGSQDSHITIATKVEGILPYVKGCYEILKVIPTLPVSNYEIEELIAQGFLT